MFVIIQSVSGPAAGKRVHLRAGQTARFGRTEWADYSFAEDSAMSDVHFTIVCDPRDGCRLTSDGGSATLLNGEEVTEAGLHHGNEITAGRTVFRVHIEDEPVAANPSHADAGDAGDDADDSIRAARLCADLALSDEAKSLLRDESTPDEYFSALLEEKLLRDATLFLARWLPKRAAIWWACLCLSAGAQPSDAGDSPLAHVVRWIHSPSDENRRAAMDAANRTEMKTPESWLAAAVFWSEGSLGAPEYEAPPAAEHLTAVGVNMALTLLAGTGTPPEVAKQYEQILQQGLQIQSGEIETPPPDAEP